MKQTDSGFYINQAKYARNLVKRFGLDKAAHARTLMAANAKLTNDPSGESINVTLYRSMIGCLLYLITSRLDIAFNVGVCSRFQSNPKISHLNVVKRIIKFVSGTCDYGLFYSKESNLSLPVVMNIANRFGFFFFGFINKLLIKFARFFFKSVVCHWNLRIMYECMSNYI